MDNLNVSICNGKYTVVQDKDYKLVALRYGEPWRDCCGDNLIYNLASEIQKLRSETRIGKFIETLDKEVDDGMKMIDYLKIANPELIDELREALENYEK